VARDRKRAKQRQRRAARGPLPAPSRTHRANVPGELDHASGEVEQFENALVAGAAGEPLAEGDPDAADEVVAAAELESEAELDLGPGAGDLAATSGGAPREQGPRPGGNRIVNFMRASWAELQRVQWPDRRQVAQATAVVLGFTVIAGLYLGLADFVFSRLVNAIL
jgi:preprotein translocase subunit SecE